MSRPHTPIKTRCYDCAEPSKRQSGASSDFYTDDGIIWECDKEDCEASEKEHQRLMKKVFDAFRD